MYRSTIYIAFFLFVFLSPNGYGQNLWTDSPLTENARTNLESVKHKELPKAFRLLELDATSASRILGGRTDSSSCLSLPLPDGTEEAYSIMPTRVLPSGLASKYPNLLAYRGRSLTNPKQIVHFVWSPEGLHVMGDSDEGTFFIDRVKSGNKTLHMSYLAKDRVHEPFTCSTEEPLVLSKEELATQAKQPNIVLGTELRTYRIAVAFNGALTDSYGGVANAMTRVVELVNDLNLIVERDLCIHYEIAENNDQILFTSQNDPYGGSNYLSQNTSVVNATIGVESYDLGMIMVPAGAGGISLLGATCSDLSKAATYSPDDLLYAAHELGHNMGAGHTYNYCPGYGYSNFEPGSGNSLMSYYGFCGTANMPGGLIYRYYTRSFDQIYNRLHIGNNNCAAITPSGNTPPIADAGTGEFYIPSLTPFTLTGNATDAEGTASLTYSWDQYDYGNGSPPWAPTGNGPVFRMYPIADVPYRTFPELSKIVNGVYDKDEVLPDYTRMFNFRFTVHDNHPGGSGLSYDDLRFYVEGNAGPFEVTLPNENTTIWSVGQSRTITWEVANTDVAPIDAMTVNILLSTDGGYTYPISLANAVPNDGEHIIVVPDAVGLQNRIKIEASENVFFDISDNDFEILPATASDFSVSLNTLSRSVCSETMVDYEIELFGLGAFTNSVDLIISGLPVEASVNLPSSVATTSSTLFTISNLDLVPKGIYPLTLTLNETGGGISKTVPFYLIVKGTSTGELGTAMSFDGSSSISIPKVGLDYQFGKEQDFSVDFWFKTTATSGVLIGDKDWNNSNNIGWAIALLAGKIRFNLGDGTSWKNASSSNTYNDNEWHHLTATVSRSGAGKLHLYIDGELVANNLAAVGDISNNMNLTIGADANGNWNYIGLIEEVRIWRNALTKNELREIRHRTLATCQENLISSYSFNENTTQVVDATSAYHGSMNGATRIPSTVPMGLGIAESKTEVASLVPFPLTQLQIDYSAQNGAEVTATKITHAPSNILGVHPSDILLDTQCWILDRYEESGSLEMTLTFGLNEDITVVDEGQPIQLQLYHRPSNSADDWVLLMNATGANAANDEVSFAGVGETGQFLITRSTEPVLAVSSLSGEFCPKALETSLDDALYFNVEGVNLIEPVTVTPPTGFEISLSPDTNFSSNPIVLTTPSNAIAPTPVYVRFLPDAIGNYNGMITTSTTGAATRSLLVSAKAVEDASNVAGMAMQFGGNDDLISLTALTWQPTAFTLEFWLKPYSLVAWNQQVGVGWGRFLFLATPEGAFYAGIETSYSLVQSPPGTLKVNQWSHCAITFDNGLLKVYHNGEFMGSQINAMMPLPWSGYFRIGQTNSNAVHGEMDEFRLWDNARTQQEIRENMHLTIEVEDDCTSGLMIYYQFDDVVEGKAKDVVGNYNGTLNGDLTLVPSSVPVGEGFANTKNETSGMVDFENTGCSVDFTVQNGAEFVFTKIGNGPFGVSTLPTNAQLFDQQYWVGHRYGNGTFNGDFTFTVNEDIEPGEATEPYNFNLYRRPTFSYEDWELIGFASSVDAVENQLTFENIPTSGQFFIAKDTTPDILINANLEDFGVQLVDYSSEPQSYQIAAKNIYEPIAISVPNGFEVSTDSTTGFASFLTLAPSNSFLEKTNIYLRFHPTAEAIYLDSILHYSLGMTSETLVVSGVGKELDSTAGNALSCQEGDYLSLPRNEELLFGENQDFTVEFWLFTSSTQVNPSIMSNKNWNAADNVGWGIFYQGSEWLVNINGEGGNQINLPSNAPSLNDGRWHHLAVVFDRDSLLSLYQDGFLTNQTSIAALNGKSIDDGFPINIFQDGTGAYNVLMAGEMDEIRIWNTTRTTQQIRKHRHLTLATKENGLVAYYQFKEEEGDAIELIGRHHADFRNNSLRMMSDVPVASGFSVIEDVQNAQVYTFKNGVDDAHIDVAFSGTLPQGEVVISYLTGEPPHGTIPPNALETGYWIINNYGQNTTNITAELRFQCSPNWVDSPDPLLFQVNGRNENAPGAEAWTRQEAATLVDINRQVVTLGGVGEFSQFLLSRATLVFSPKIFLQGAYEPNRLMRNGLRQEGLIPLQEPYAALNYPTNGGEQTTSDVLAQGGNDAILDWIFIELRDKNDPTNALYGQSVLLQRDGDIVAVDGTSPVQFDRVPADDYYIAVYHRNHLGIMTANPIPLNSTTTPIDFTTSLTPTWGTNAQADVGNGKLALWSGDASSDKVVNAQDRAATWNNRNQQGYFSFDVNLDGACNAADRAITWNNRNRATKIP